MEGHDAADLGCLDDEVVVFEVIDFRLYYFNFYV
jgi:hypothetical protein